METDKPDAIAFLMGVQLGLIAEWDARRRGASGFSLFVWCSTFGGFAVVVYFLMSLGALAGIATDPAKVKLVIAAILGLLILRGGDLWVVPHKVPSPTILAPGHHALGLFVVGLLVAVLVKGRAPASGARGLAREGDAERGRPLIV